MHGGGGGHGGGHGGHGGPDGGMGGGQASQSPPPALLIQCDEHAILSLKPWRSRRPLGFIVLALGFAALWSGGRSLFAPMEPMDAGVADAAMWGAVLFLVLGLLFCYAGYSQLKPVTLRLDVPTRTYVLCTGWWPWRKEIQDSWEDISQVSLHTYSPYGKGTTLFLYWRDPRRARFALHTDEAQEALRYRQVIARLLGIPYLGENWKLVYPEGVVPPVSPKAPKISAGNEVPFATSPSLPRELRTLAVWLVLPTLVALTLLNSYGNGLTLVREGHDKEGGRWICSTSLWKNDSLYVDAQGNASLNMNSMLK